MSVVEYPTPYRLEKFDPAVIFRPYHHLFDDIAKHQEYRQKQKSNIAKVLLSERISGQSIADSQESAPYLEYNAQTMGDFDLRYKINVINQCQKSVIWFEGDVTGTNYVKKVHCRKQWCPVCGGKKGIVHKSRLHSILSRVDVDRYNIRQLILTVPQNLRELLKDRDNLSKLNKLAKDLASKYFGVPLFDKKGHVKSYKLEKGVISYLHLFGDKNSGVFKPHVNLHILESLSEKLELSDSVLKSIKAYWLKRLREFDKSLNVVNVYYSFRLEKPEKLHALKYMSKAWSHQDFEAINDDDHLKKLLVIDLSGFQYLRFWGALSNCNYKDEMSIPEITQDCEKLLHEKLIPLFVAPMDFKSWQHRLIEIHDGLYRVLKGANYEPENSKENKKTKEK